jgi:hypothetical protein
MSITRQHGVQYQTFITWIRKRRQNSGPTEIAGPALAGVMLNSQEATPAGGWLHVFLPCGAMLEIDSHATPLLAVELPELFFPACHVGHHSTTAYPADYRVSRTTASIRNCPPAPPLRQEKRDAQCRPTRTPARSRIRKKAHAADPEAPGPAAEASAAKKLAPRKPKDISHLPVHETHLIPDEVQANPHTYREIDRATTNRFAYQRALIFIERTIRPVFMAREIPMGLHSKLPRSHRSVPCHTQPRRLSAGRKIQPPLAWRVRPVWSDLTMTPAGGRFWLPKGEQPTPKLSPQGSGVFTAYH